MTEHSTTDHPVSNHPEHSRNVADPQATQTSPGTAEPPVAWYDIHIGSQQFTIASRKGEAHVRSVERLIGETVQEMDGLLDGQGPASTAILIALNLADKLQTIFDSEKQMGDRSASRLQALVGRLSSALDNPANPGDYGDGEHTSAVYEKLEFF